MPERKPTKLSSDRSPLGGRDIGPSPSLPHNPSRDGRVEGATSGQHVSSTALPLPLPAALTLLSTLLLAGIMEYRPLQQRASIVHRPLRMS